MSFLKKIFGGPKIHTVELVPSERTFETRSGRTVLESALSVGIDYPHDCTVGTCGSCRTLLKRGEVDAITPFGYTLSKDELAAGYILACQAVAKSDLTLEIDLAAGGDRAVSRQAATITAIEDLTHDIKRVTWRVETPLNWRAGQYCNVRWGGTEHRSYSFAHAAARDGSSEVTTFVRHVPGGAFTDILFKGDPAALTYEIDAPHGQFWLRDGNGPIVCVAGGSGLAPVLALLEDAARRRVRRDCILLFGARGARDLYAMDEIERIREAWTASFDYWPVLSEEQSEGVRHGFVTAHLDAALDRLGPGAQAYMCGPPPMIDAALHTLKVAGVALEDIHYDKFTDASTAASTIEQ